MNHLAIACAAGAVLVLGCSSESSGGASGGSTSATSTTTSSSATTSSSTSGGGGSGGSTGSGGAGGTSGEGGSGGLGECLPAAEPFGTNVDNGESFPDLQFTACDGTKLTMDKLRCKNKLTLLSIGAGWCEPCKEETPGLETASADLAPFGIGVVQVIIQDASSNPATTLFCEQWVEQFSLTYPVFIDPIGNSVQYVDDAALPINIAIDHDGKVRWLVTGQVPADLENTLKALVP